MNPTNKPKLILPQGVAQQREAQKQDSTPQEIQKVKLPPELAREVRNLTTLATEINTQVEAILEKGSAALIALLQQPAVRTFLQEHQARMLPGFIVHICNRDRTNMLNGIVQVMQQELAASPMNGAPPLHAETYQRAFEVFHAVASRLEPPSPGRETELPEFDLGEETSLQVVTH